MDFILPAIIALLLAFVAWKVLVGMVKMAAIVAVLVLAGAYYFGFGGLV